MYYNTSIRTYEIMYRNFASHTRINSAKLVSLLCSKLHILNCIVDDGISSRCDSCRWNVWCLVGTIGKVVWRSTCKLLHTLNVNNSFNENTKFLFVHVQCVLKPFNKLFLNNGKYRQQKTSTTCKKEINRLYRSHKTHKNVIFERKTNPIV